MKLFELTSGVIAAVLIALGAYQYVNNTKVEEEPVVKEHVSVLAEAWFSVEVTDPLNQDDSEEQVIQAMLGNDVEEPCNDEEGTLCAVKISYNPSDTEAQALISRIDTPNPPTVADFENLTNPATAIDHSYNDEE